MHYTIELLIKNHDSLLVYYQRARQLWEEIMSDPQMHSEDALADQLTAVQWRFEQECGGRWVGQEIMAIVGICQFYSTDIGFDTNEENVLRVYKAFRASYCSLEVKGHVDELATSYHINELVIP